MDGHEESENKTGINLLYLLGIEQCADQSICKATQFFFYGLLLSCFQW
jgi:hypothetical protein